MSRGAITGIVVGTMMGFVLGLLIFALLWFRRRKPGKRAESEVLPPPRLDPPLLHEADGHSRPQNELSGDGHARPANELSGDGHRWELSDYKQ